MIKTEIVADSTCNGNRITTFLLTFPRFLLAEFNTHRMLSRNTASSRAIPTERMIKSVLDNPIPFERFDVANKGMSAQEEMTNSQRGIFKEDWEKHCKSACEFAEGGYYAAKQMINRVLEPFMHTTVICTATEWHNFFALRAHKDAQPEFQVLAYNMLWHYLHNDPRSCNPGGWHLPFCEQDRTSIIQSEAIFHSISKCARVSYGRHLEEKSLEEDQNIFDRLLASKHMSPFEHVAQAVDPREGAQFYGNFKGWIQYRKTLQNENREKVDLQKILDEKPDWVNLVLNCGSLAG